MLESSLYQPSAFPRRRPAPPLLLDTPSPNHTHTLPTNRAQDPEHDPDVESQEGLPPLHLAARGGHLGALAFLLGRGAHPGARDGAGGDTPLHHAARGGHALAAAALLRQEGVAVDARNFQDSQYAQGQWSAAGAQRGRGGGGL